MKTPCPPLENKGNNALDGAMKDNPGVNVEPDMSGSLASPKPNMKAGYSQGAIHGDDESPGFSNKRDQFGNTGHFNDEY